MPLDKFSPFIQFREGSEWSEDLPPGSKVFITSKVSMNTQKFVKWFEYFAEYKIPEPVLLMFDSVSSHWDAMIVEAGGDHEVTLFCLSSNTTHTLQQIN